MNVSSALDDLATTTATPWAEYAAAASNAEHMLVTLPLALVTKTNRLNLAAAENTYDLALGAAGRQQWLAELSAESNNAVMQAAQTLGTQSTATGNRDLVTLPTSVTLPTPDTGTVTLVANSYLIMHPGAVSQYWVDAYFNAHWFQYPGYLPNFTWNWQGEINGYYWDDRTAPFQGSTDIDDYSGIGYAGFAADYVHPPNPYYGSYGWTTDFGYYHGYWNYHPGLYTWNGWNPAYAGAINGAANNTTIEPKQELSEREQEVEQAKARTLVTQTFLEAAKALSPHINALLGAGRLVAAAGFAALSVGATDEVQADGTSRKFSARRMLNKLNLKNDPKRTIEDHDSIDKAIAQPLGVANAFFEEFLVPEYMSHVFETATGIFWEAPKKAFWGTVEMVHHPIQTAEGIYIAVTNPGETLLALKTQLGKTINHGSLRDQGELAGNILMVFIPGPKFTEHIAKLKTLGGKGAKLAKALATAAEAEPRLVLVEKGSQKIIDLGEAKKISEVAVADALKTLDSERRLGSLLLDIPEATEEAITLVRQEGVRIEKGTLEARQRMFNRNRFGIKDEANIVGRQPNSANAFFDLDAEAKPVIVLRKDATRVELLEEWEHFKQFKEWANTRSGQEAAKDRIAAWQKLLKDRLEHARLEVEANARVINWLKANGGTELELRFAESSYNTWFARFKKLGGK